MSFVLTRSPLRVSLLGGGADVARASAKKQWSSSFLGFAINKYIYIASTAYPRFLEKRVRLLYSKTEEVTDLNEIEHPVFREVLKKYEVEYRNFMVSSDIPGGSGLGSSSSFTLGLIHNCRDIKDAKRDPHEIIHEAIEFEQDVLMENVGVQDQVTVGIGGLGLYRYDNKNGITISKLKGMSRIESQLNNNSYLVYTGRLRRSSEFQQEPDGVRSTARAEYESRIKDVTSRFISASNSVRDAKDLFDDFVVPAWHAKRDYISTEGNQAELLKTSHILSQLGIDRHRLCGGGGGGFYYVYCDNKEEKDLMYNSFEREQIIPIQIDYSGVTSVQVGL